MISLSQAYLGRKSFDENGNKEIEEDVISERHQCDEVERSPGGGAGHAVVQHLVPVFLRQNLQTQPFTDINNSSYYPAPLI